MKLRKPCPSCAGDLALKRNPRTRGLFLGCSEWPACSHTETVPAYFSLVARGAPRLPGFDDLEGGKMEPIRIKGKLESVSTVRSKDGPYVKIVLSTDAIQKGAELGPFVDRDLDVDFYPWRQQTIWDTPKTGERPAARQATIDEAIAAAPSSEAEKEEQPKPVCPTCQNTREVQLEPGVSEPCSACTELCGACKGRGFLREHESGCDSLALNYEDTGQPGPCNCNGPAIACDPCSGRGWVLRAPTSTPPACATCRDTHEIPLGDGETDLCPDCTLRCPSCGGSGKNTHAAEAFEMLMPCPTCGGEGWTIKPAAATDVAIYPADMPGMVTCSVVVEPYGRGGSTSFACAICDEALKSDHERAVQDGQAEPCDHRPPVDLTAPGAVDGLIRAAEAEIARKKQGEKAAQGQPVEYAG